MVLVLVDPLGTDMVVVVPGEVNKCIIFPLFRTMVQLKVPTLHDVFLDQ